MYFEIAAFVILILFICLILILFILFVFHETPEEKELEEKFEKEVLNAIISKYKYIKFEHKEDQEIMREQINLIESCMKTDTKMALKIAENFFNTHVVERIARKIWNEKYENSDTKSI